MSDNEDPITMKEFFLVVGEDSIRITEDKIVRVEYKVHLDYFHMTATAIEIPPCRFCVRYAVSRDPLSIRPLAL